MKVSSFSNSFYKNYNFYFPRLIFSTLLFLVFLNSGLRAQKAAGIDISYPNAAESLVLCEGSGTFNVQLQVIAATGINSPFQVQIAMPTGIL